MKRFLAFWRRFFRPDLSMAEREYETNRARKLDDHEQRIREQELAIERLSAQAEIRRWRPHHDRDAS